LTAGQEQTPYLDALCEYAERKPARLLSGLRPTFAAPEVDPELGIAHCLTDETLVRALDTTPGRSPHG
jgi:hypothetical protein